MCEIRSEPVASAVVLVRQQLRRPALPSAVPVVRGMVTRVLGRLDVSTARSGEIQLAVTEACANVVRHAYPGAPGDVLCECEVTEHEVVIRVSDWGVGWDQPSAHPGLGLGIPLIERLSDHATQTHSQGITLMEMRFARRGELAAKIR